jgi:hypothetical protein
MPLDPKWHGNGSPRRTGVRNRLSNRFLEDCYASWEKHGPAALEEARYENPTAYCGMMMKIVPKEQLIEVGRASNLSPEQYDAAIEFFRKQLAAAEEQERIQKQLLIDVLPENGSLIPNPIDQNPWAHWRSPMDMMRQG